MRGGRLLAALVLTVLATGCTLPAVGAQPPPSTGSPLPLPPRPRELPLDRIDVCALLGEEQVDALGVSPGVDPPLQATSEPICFFQNKDYPKEPDESYAILLDRARGAEQFVGSRGARLVDVSGFGAVEYVPVGASATSYCKLAVDVAPGQNLAVDYSYRGSALAMTRELACEKAHTAAEMAVRTLTEQAGG